MSEETVRRCLEGTAVDLQVDALEGRTTWGFKGGPAQGNADGSNICAGGNVSFVIVG